MTSRALTWSHAFHEARHRERRVEERDLERMASDIAGPRHVVGWLESALDRLVAILAVVGVRSW
jgi:hypothetical protein